MESFTLACVWVVGPEKRRRYGADYVQDLVRHVRAHTSRPFETVCLTNRTNRVPAGIRAVKIPYPMDAKKRPARGWWAKVELFNPKRELAPPGSRVLYLDLDTLPVGDLDSILDYPEPFAICKGKAPTFSGKGNRRTIHRFNSSVMVWDYGQATELFSDYDASKTMYLWGDQDWIALRRPDLAMFPGPWITKLLEEGPVWGPEVRVVLCSKTKPHQAREKWPWFAERW